MTLRRRNSFNAYDKNSSNENSPPQSNNNSAEQVPNIIVTKLDSGKSKSAELKNEKEHFPPSPPRSEVEDYENESEESEKTDSEGEEGSEDDYYTNPLWDYLQSELQVNEYDMNYEIKLERVRNFFKVPQYIEKLMVFGICICLNTLLFIFTILPLRVLLTLFQIVNPFNNRKLNTIQKLDLLKFLLIVISSLLLINIDASIIYHNVKNQSFIKLVVILNMTEIFDKLLSSFGQDILDSFFAEITLGKITSINFKLIRKITISTIYISIHTICICYQMICLNVAINSSDNSLLSLLLSNQFVEIKSTVFKRWERENLFQVCCGDMVERFQISILLIIIMVRNFLELWGSWIAFNKLGDFSLPLIWELIPTNLQTIWNLILSPIVIVLAAEILVDWLKHAFITKFNHIRPTVFDRYIDLLCKDLIPQIPLKLDNNDGNGGNSGSKPNILMDQSSVVARRIGFAVFPISCLIIRMSIHILTSLNIITTFNYDKFVNLYNNIHKITLNGLAQKSLEFIPVLIVGIFIYLFLLLLKLILGLRLIRFGLSRYIRILDRERLDNELAVRDKELGEKEYREIKHKLSKYPEDLYKGVKLSLNNVERYSLFKSRIP
ncbi:DUF747-domain-containing protein [Conidiobolus coronatus NRRL 28638]|uniref:DUF747-domain-containing protein n=1 Tax=Conidiobolus coronatus (strain ATCC 28846 / CBS 209.66 / NRRL 28638) TaxID=796925 RepID=A0A137NPW1_CONC2|nr:DUF747-domain-containing protein [Conidiobolus coronatus NRRL 28638]|eukprot:KXN64778.1 DUF747-domain-containing protein [Conidiobolus coronatus NRRL 28638]